MVSPPRSTREELTRALLAPGILFALLTVVFLVVVTLADLAAWAMLLLAVPLAPVLWALGRVDRVVEGSDELQRMILLRGMASGFLVTISLAMIGAVAQLAGIESQFPLFTVVAGLSAWFGNTLHAARKYR